MIEEIIDDAHDFNWLISTLEYNHHYKRVIKILDVGCGIGSTIFKRTLKEYWGIDIDKFAIEEFQDKLNKIEGYHNLLNNDFLKYEFEKTKFDLVIHNNSLNEFPFEKLDETLSKSYALLNTSGLIFICANSTEHSDVLKAKNESEFEVKEISPNKFYIQSNGYIKNYFEKKELISLLDRNKFSIMNIRKEEIEHPPEKEIISKYTFIAIKK